MLKSLQVETSNLTGQAQKTESATLPSRCVDALDQLRAQVADKAGHGAVLVRVI